MVQPGEYLELFLTILLSLQYRSNSRIQKTLNDSESSRKLLGDTTEFQLQPNSVSISCGWNHAAITSEKGNVFTFGHNTYGQLGLGHVNLQDIPCVVAVLSSKPVTHVACGGAHTIFVQGN